MSRKRHLESKIRKTEKLLEELREELAREHGFINMIREELPMFEWRGDLDDPEFSSDYITIFVKRQSKDEVFVRAFYPGFQEYAGVTKVVKIDQLRDWFPELFRLIDKSLKSQIDDLHRAACDANAMMIKMEEGADE